MRRVLFLLFAFVLMACLVRGQDTIPDCNCKKKDLGRCKEKYYGVCKEYLDTCLKPTTIDKAAFFIYMYQYKKGILRRFSSSCDWKIEQNNRNPNDSTIVAFDGIFRFYNRKYNTLLSEICYKEGWPDYEKYYQDPSLNSLHNSNIQAICDFTYKKDSLVWVWKSKFNKPNGYIYKVDEYGYKEFIHKGKLKSKLIKLDLPVPIQKVQLKNLQ